MNNEEDEFLFSDGSSEEDLRKELRKKLEKLIGVDSYKSKTELKHLTEEEEAEFLSNEEVYEGYREFPVTIASKDGTPLIKLDMKFVETCHDYGRYLAFADYDNECAKEQASEFVSRLVFPSGEIKSKQYDKDMIAKSFGLSFVNYGFSEWQSSLNEEDISMVSSSVVKLLHENHIL